jgi:hypothetical protein
VTCPGCAGAHISRTRVGGVFWTSAEHRGIEVDQYYQTFLHRNSDAGRSSWVNLFLSGATEVTVMYAFLNTPEYQAAHSTDQVFINGLYTDVLGRPADAAGLSYWLQRLQNGTSRSTAEMSFLTSDEGYRHDLNGYYMALLGRPLDNGGATAWIAWLRSGRTNLSTIAAIILGSQEYFQRSLT